MQLKHPIVLVHGLGAKHRIGPLDYFYGIAPWLRKGGNTVYVAELDLWHGTQRRSQQLKDQVQHLFPETKVNLVAHSMGGLDCRMAISKLNMHSHVASLTTIGTPHGGTHLADLASERLPEKWVKAADQAMHSLGMSNDGLKMLSNTHVNQIFNSENPDHPSVQYFSATTVIRKPLLKYCLPLFWPTYHVLKKQEGDNDGFVSEESSRWGTVICTDFGDHYAQIGQVAGRTRGLDYLKFWDRIMTHLRKEGL